MESHVKLLLTEICFSQTILLSTHHCLRVCFLIALNFVFASEIAIFASFLNGGGLLQHAVCT